MEKTYIEKIHIARNRLKAEYKDSQKHLVEQIKKMYLNINLVDNNYYLDKLFDDSYYYITLYFISIFFVIYFVTFCITVNIIIFTIICFFIFNNFIITIF